MKTCPTCSSQAAVLITNIENGQQFCHQCSSTACPSFLPSLVYTSEDVKFLRDCGIDPETQRIEDYCKWPSAKVQWDIGDLMFLREAHIRIDDETFTSVLHYENMHRDFAPCPDCRATTFTQHDSLCRYASLLWEPDWYEIVEARDRNR
jgi:hypothetical protein